MGVFSNIQRGLDTKLATLSGLPAVAWPNVKYTPTLGTTFLRPTVLPSSSDLVTLTDHRVNPGIYQVDIFCEAEKGLNAALTLADNIKTLFETSRRITSGSDTIFIKNVSVGRAERQDAWIRLFIEINYECYSE
jgi:Bacteriophage related domain of unknown function